MKQLSPLSAAVLRHSHGDLSRSSRVAHWRAMRLVVAGVAVALVAASSRPDQLPGHLIGAIVVVLYFCGLLHEIRVGRSDRA